MEELPEGIPNLPGVYQFKNADNILYIGKARNLKKRLRSYFTSNLSVKDKRIVQQSDSIEYTVTSNEIEALILEENEIKEYKPKYNIRLKDDKRYPYIKITIDEKYPRIFYTRNIEDDSSLYFGPYTDVQSVRRALKSIHNIFPVRTCPGKKLPDRECLKFHINKCVAPCIDMVSREEYMDFVNEVIDFLKGKTKELEKTIEKRMWKASEELNYEMASIYRNQLMSLRDLTKKQRMVLGDSKSRDIIGIHEQHSIACTVVLQIREGKMVNKEHYFLETGEDSEISEYLRRFITGRYSRVSFVPEEINVPATVNDKSLLEEWFDTRIRIATRGDLKSLLDMANRNAGIELNRELSRPPKKRVQSLLALQELLALEKTPERIEGYDISNISGTDPVGSCVVFVNGIPKKSEYRRFRIKEVQGINDSAMISEVVSRRIKMILDESDSIPDLILIDGGKPQLNAALGVMKEIKNLNIPTVALAKRLEEIHLPTGKIISLPINSPVLKLLMRVRNEAHRFAVDYHRRLRKKRLSISELDEIEGIGYKKKIALIQHFGSTKRLGVASREEIQEVKGIGPKLANRIYNVLH